MGLPPLRPNARILFVSNTRIGDVVLSTGLLGLLIEAFPRARFTVVAGYLACSLFEGAPVERVIALRKQRFNGHWLSLYLRLLRPWDLVIDLRGSALAWMVPTRHRRTIGSSDLAEPRVVQLARLLDTAPPPAPRVWIRQRDREAASRLVPTDVDFLAVAPGAAVAAKRWPADRFAAMLNKLTDRHAFGAPLAVVLVGAADEAALVEAVRSALVDRPSVPRPLIVLGEPHLPVVAAVLERARLYIGNDSGLMHLAAACGTPTVGLFGPTPSARYGPWGDRTLVVQPEGMASDWAPQPITDLAVEQVVDRVTEFASRIGLAREEVD